MKGSSSGSAASTPDLPDDEGTYIAIPVLNDWAAVGAVIERLAVELGDSAKRTSVLLIDDGSDEPVDPDRLAGSCARFAGVEVLQLRRNLGHQRAIAVGLAFLQAERICSEVVVLDGNGEDRPRVGSMRDSSVRLENFPVIEEYVRSTMELIGIAEGCRVYGTRR